MIYIKPFYLSIYSSRMCRRKMRPCDRATVRPFSITPATK